MNTHKKFAVLRIAFGLVWAIDACMKWQPAFLGNLAGYLSTDGQPAWIAKWIHFSAGIVGTAPHFYAVIIAIAETVIAISLIFGLYTKQIAYGGMVLAFVIWSTAEGFGGPYTAGCTDIGCAVIYIFVFSYMFTYLRNDF